jgi:glycosyltransferase involved in cell wall biosynthesis
VRGGVHRGQPRLRRLRSLILPDWYPSAEDPLLGTFIREKARAIALRHDVAVLYARPRRRPGGALFSLSDEDDDGLRTVRVDYRRLPVAAATLGPRLAGTRAGLQRLEASGFEPDLIHAHVFPAGLSAVLLALGRGLPVIVSENSTLFPREELTAAQRRMARLAFERADLVCPASEDLGRHIARIAPRARIRPVPNTVDTSLFSPPERPASPEPGPARALVVALLEPKKGLDVLLQALAEVSDGPTVQVVGDGPSRPELEALAVELGVAGSVEFLGRRDKAEVARLMRESDFFVLPSLWENLPNAVIEAMASGLPVVATRTGGVPEMVNEGSGLLVAPGDAAELAGALRGMVGSHRLYDRAAIARRAREHYGLEAVSALWDEVYREVLGRARSRSTRARSRRASAR